jgi:ribosomal protein S6--L-glutamate ligase
LIKAALISLGSVSSKWTSDAMRKYFDVVDEIDLRAVEVRIGSKGDGVILVNETPLKKYDCIYAKGSYKYSQLLQAIATIISKDTYMPYVPQALTLVHDKLLTQIVLEKEEIPMPKTYVAATLFSAKKTLEKMSFPVIIKIPQGTQGKGVMYAESYAAASSMLDTLENLKQPFLLQEYIDTDNTDLRLIVVGDKVVASMRRKGRLDEKRANIHAGGVGEAYDPDAHTKNIAIKSAKAVGAEIVGIDILESPKGPKVIEANISPGLQGITKATGIDVADKIAKYLYDKTFERKNASTSVDANKVFNDLGIKSDEHTHKSEIITKLDFRGERILLPLLLTKMTSFKEDDEYCVEACKDSLKIRKLKKQS